jgi:hypothetical protein
MIEERLLKIIEAADPDDSDDIAIRRLLATALGECGAELAQIANGHFPWSMPCERRAARRFSVLRSASRTALAARCRPETSMQVAVIRRCVGRSRPRR